MKYLYFYTAMTMLMFLHFSAGAKKKMTRKDVVYNAGGKNLVGYIAYDAGMKGKHPAVLVVHEWWGRNDYVKHRADMLAEMGYVAFAVDMYGDAKIAPDPKTAKEYASPFYANPALAKQMLDAAYDQLLQMENVDREHIAGIGYCFGGGMLLNMAKMGMT